MKRRTLVVTGGVSAVGLALAGLFVRENAVFSVKGTSPPPREPQGIALVVGVGRLDRTSYGVVDPLDGYTEDVKCIGAMLRQRRFAVYATRVDGKAEGLLTDIETIGTSRVAAGDTFILYFTGHGCLIPHRNLRESLFVSSCSQAAPPPLTADGVPLEPAWCLANRAVLGSEIYDAIRRTFPAGVHVLIVADSCHSGRIVATVPSILAETRPRAKELDDVYARNAKLYDSIAAALPRAPAAKPLGADISLLAACRDSEVTPDGQPMSQFTTRLLSLWFAKPLLNGCEVLTPRFSGTLQDLGVTLGAQGPPTPQLFCPPGAQSPLLNRAAFSF